MAWRPSQASLPTPSAPSPPVPDGRSSLSSERASASFAPSSLESLLRGGEAALSHRRSLLSQLTADPVLAPGRLDDAFLSREEKLAARIERAARVRAVHLCGATAERRAAFDSLRLAREGGPLEKAGGLALHVGMFMPTIELMGTAEQAARWMPLARSCSILGTYAQTELGHGTNLSRLETSANFDAEADEFVLHSPSVSAIKWWPGGLGKTSTHAIVMANLYIGGVKRGQHAFLVQLRDLRTHEPLPGIELGDIGPKMGYDSVDNGYLRLTHVRVPRDHLLQRHARVERDGTYTRMSDNPKAVYGVMLIIRVYLVDEASLALQHATTIATRYSAVRRQGGAGPVERQLLDYATQQARLFPLIAAAYAMHFAARDVRSAYDAYRRGGSGLAQLHAHSAALKSYATTLAASGIETCRLLCGGHGYSLASGLPDLYAEFTPAQTYEGDNNVMLLQVARWLVKRLGTGGSRPAGTHPTLQHSEDGNYLSLDQAPLPEGLADQPPEAVAAAALRGLAESARVLARRAAARLSAAVASGCEPEVAFSEVVGVELAEAGAAHARLLLAAAFVRALGMHRDAPPAVLNVLRRLCALHAASELARHAVPSLLESGWMSPRAAADIRAAIDRLLRMLRPDAVALVDAFGMSDWELSSVLGRADGDVYAHLLAWARRSPLNKTEQLEAFEKFVRPRMGHEEVGSITSKL